MFLKFYRDYSIALVGLKTNKNSGEFLNKLPLVVVYYNVDFSIENREGTQYWRKKILPIANKVCLFFYLFI